MKKNGFKILIILFAAMFVAGNCYAETAEQIEARRRNAQNKIYKLKLLEKIESKKLYNNQQKLEETQENLSINKDKYAKTQENLTSLRKQLDASIKDYENHKSASNKRIVSIYKKQRQNYVEFLLNAQDINNLLDRLYFENLIMKIDRENIKTSQRKTRNILTIKQKIEEQQRYLDANIKVMNKQEKNIKNAISQQEKYIQKLQTDRATWERAERELARQSEQLTKLINKSVKDEKEVIVTGGTFLRPTNGRVTSPYGYRTHPIFKKRIFHSGVDLGSPAGTPIKAANSGKVIFVGWYGGYGKVVILDHGTVNGKPTTTLYAHMDSIAVSNGQYVTKGQTLGYEGTTGYSTGPHCHFEVRTNGQPNNPLNYI